LSRFGSPFVVPARNCGSFSSRAKPALLPLIRAYSAAAVSAAAMAPADVPPTLTNRNSLASSVMASG